MQCSYTITHTYTHIRASLLCSHAPPTSACECLSDLYCVQSKQRERGKPCRAQTSRAALCWQQDERQTDRDWERERQQCVVLNVEIVLSELYGKLCMRAAVRLRDAATLAARAACLPLLVRGKDRPAIIRSEWTCFSILTSDLFSVWDRRSVYSALFHAFILCSHHCLGLLWSGR